MNQNPGDNYVDILDLAVNMETISEGDWVDQIPEMGDLRLKVRGMMAPKVQALQARKLRAVPKNKRGRDGMPLFAVTVQVMTEVLFEAVLLDWDGLSADGKPVKYSPELSKQWLSDLSFQKFADAVIWAARCVDNGKAKAADDLVGN